MTHTGPSRQALCRTSSRHKLRNSAPTSIKLGGEMRPGEGLCRGHGNRGWGRVWAGAQPEERKVSPVFHPNTYARKLASEGRSLFHPGQAVGQSKLLPAEVRAECSTELTPSRPTEDAAPYPS